MDKSYKTPGPWSYDSYGGIYGVKLEEGREPNRVRLLLADRDEPGTFGAERDDNLKHAFECIKFCEGIETESLRQIGIPFQDMVATMYRELVLRLLPDEVDAVFPEEWVTLLGLEVDAGAPYTIYDQVYGIVMQDNWGNDLEYSSIEEAREECIGWFSQQSDTLEFIILDSNDIKVASVHRENYEGEDEAEHNLGDWAVIRKPINGSQWEYFNVSYTTGISKERAQELQKSLQATDDQWVYSAFDWDWAEGLVNPDNNEGDPE